MLQLQGSIGVQQFFSFYFLGSTAELRFFQSLASLFLFVLVCFGIEQFFARLLLSQALEDCRHFSFSSNQCWWSGIWVWCTRMQGAMLPLEQVAVCVFLEVHQQQGVGVVSYFFLTSSGSCLCFPLQLIDDGLSRFYTSMLLIPSSCNTGGDCGVWRRQEFYSIVQFIDRYNWSNRATNYSNFSQRGLVFVFSFPLILQQARDLVWCGCFWWLQWSGKQDVLSF